MGRRNWIKKFDEIKIAFVAIIVWIWMGVFNSILVLISHANVPNDLNYFSKFIQLSIGVFKPLKAF